MFVVVRYGAEQQQIVNIDCKIANFLDFIKAKSGCSADDIVDVSDVRGQVKHLRGHPKDCAKKYLKDRETLIVLKVDTQALCYGEAYLHFTNYHLSRRPGANDDPVHSAGKTVTGKAVYTPLLLSLVSNKEFNDALNPHPEEGAASNALPSKPRRARSFTFDKDEFRRARSKTRSSWSSSGKKSTPRNSRKI